ncbi:MAG: YXWGXW repeat-containing protein [Gemmatimonadota bacterium]|nr:YXWGXW repeat-containing protein [Gemmatimonadota bacterium]MDE3127543.1 YXWGXW repeat-containing protein [Gemmatimonadota bacterium]MDE3172907.1 YXWGXW repeat-containing protein [Gemmatimonadota bacterium]MDE3215923.1 YXWGXW repeat-containing protein [Gemmatimonadota bacterium]
MLKSLRSAAATLALVAVAGCVIVPARAGVVYVRRAPPASRVEVVSVAPGRQMVWVGGYWAWRHDDYLWVPGHWAHVPDGYRDWVAGRWDHDRHGWFFIQGYWR